MIKTGTALACALITVGACTGSSEQVDLTALPSAYSAPFICDHVPKIAVERMTGITDPLTTGAVELASGDPLRPATGACAAYQRTGERSTVLRITQDVGGSRGHVESYLREGMGKQLPEIVPGGISYYASYPNEEAHVAAMLVKGKARLAIELVKGVKGRDNVADVVALMKLIAPKLIDTADTDEDG
ncbi:MAG TPA: hypothetical protein VKZ82_06045 [Nonomuraea sp.]|nr:hypothetical protein [Nonomuraea sp.]